MSLFAEFKLHELAFAAGIAITCAFLIRRSHRYFSRQRKKNRGVIVKTSRPERHSAGHHLDLPDEALRWEVQMQEIAREVSGQIDSKMGALQALVADADRAAQRLEAATGAFEKANLTTDDPPKQESKDSSQALPPSEIERAEVFTLADYGFSTADIASRLRLAQAQIEAVLDARSN